MKKFLKISFNILKYIYLAILVIYLVFIAIHRISIDRSVLGYRLYSINNNEMYPKYKVNDIVIVEDINVKKLKVGDTISYRANCCGMEGMVVNHKIEKIDVNDENICFVTKGINSNIEDPMINSKQVIGKVVGILPVINFLHHIFKNIIGFFVVVVLPLVIAIIVSIIQTIKDMKKEKVEIKEEEKEDEIEIL